MLQRDKIWALGEDEARNVCTEEAKEDGSREKATWIIISPGFTLPCRKLPFAEGNNFHTDFSIILYMHFQLFQLSRDNFYQYKYFDIATLVITGKMHLGPFVTIGLFTIVYFVKQIRLVFPVDPSAPIRSCSADPIFCRLLLPRQNFFPLPTRSSLTLSPPTPPAHLQMRRSFFSSGFLTKMELKRWKTHQPSHSRCKQWGWSADKAEWACN